MNTKVLSESAGNTRSAENTEVAMSAQHDRLAQVLQDISERFPDDAFTKHGRLRGLLADHLPDAEREIRVALDAIDEGVVDMYAKTATEELGMRIDRLVMRLENSRGIREDIGRPVVLAYGYALGAGELPSATLTVARQPEQVATEVNDSGDDWIGATVIAGNQDTPVPQTPTQPAGTQSANTQPAATAPVTTPAAGSSRNGMIALGVAAILGLAYIGNQPDPEPVVNSPATGEQQAPATAPQRQDQEQAPTPTPQDETVQEVVTAKPSPQPTPTTQPTKPVARETVPKAQPRLKPTVPAATATAYWYDPYGVVWQIEFNGAEFQGIGRQNNVPVASMIGLLDQASNQIQYELYNALDVPMGVGEGTMTDPTHIQFITYDGFGLVIGQGTFHINHPPNG